MKKRTFLRRMVMILLLLGAIYTTISTISNVTMNDIFMNEQHVMVDSAGDKIMQENEQKMLSTILKSELPDQINQAKNGKSLEAIEQAIKEKYPKEHVIATGYTAGPESTGKTKDHPEYGITYSGIEATRSLYSTIAADLTVYPLGTIMYIPEYGYGVVADKGSAIIGNKIDLYYQTVDDVYHEWGKKELDVYIVKFGDGSVTAAEMEQLNENATLEVFGEE